MQGVWLGSVPDASMTDTLSSASFQQTQRAFAAHIRDPHANPAPVGIEDRRMKIYRDLFYNSIESFLQNGFPVLRAILDDETWHRLVRLFFASHASQSPYFVEIPEEFVRFLSESNALPSGLPPWLLELAHYECMELVLDVSTEVVPSSGVNPTGNVLSAAPVLTPLMCVLSYQWPVHKISPDFLPDKPLEQPVWLVIFRNDQDRVHFLEVSGPTAALLQLIEASPLLSGRQVLTELAATLGISVDQSIEFGSTLLSQMREQCIIIGTRLEDVDNLESE
tara:strand:- start:112950 stop:113786 length:837 start_codon:yes stop_codon:yes gene_type:complete